MMTQQVKNLPAVQETMGLFPGSGRFLRGWNVNPLQYSGLVNPMDRGAWRATVQSVAKSQTQVRDWACTCTLFHCLYSFKVILGFLSPLFSSSICLKFSITNFFFCYFVKFWQVRVEGRYLLCGQLLTYSLVLEYLLIDKIIQKKSFNSSLGNITS